MAFPLGAEGPSFAHLPITSALQIRGCGPDVANIEAYVERLEPQFALERDFAERNGLGVFL